MSGPARASISYHFKFRPGIVSELAHTPHHADQLTECCNILEKAGCWFEVHSGTISTPTNGVFLEADKIEALLAKHGKVVTKHKHARLVEAHYVDGEGRKPWERGHVNT